MLHTLFIALGIFMSLSFTPMGPMPHERVDTPKKSNAHSGRYIYLGDVPKFEAQEIELIISKMSLSTRVKAYVNQELIDNYAKQLYFRWKTIRDAFEDRSLSFHPLIKISDLAQDKSPTVRSWARIAEQYSSHILENAEFDIYQSERNAKNYVSFSDEETYKKDLIESYFRYLFDTTISSEFLIRDGQFLEELLSQGNSRRLFQKHMGKLFTKDDSKKNYLGYLSLVYPIAATVEGPFDQPAEKIYDLKTAESMDARWWSDKWKDEFGGFPFLLIEWSGVAFHGPISNYLGLEDVWFLRRGYVSHGCHRMDSSDILELRTLMPEDLKKAAGKIKVTVLNHFDVVDWNKDGKEEVIDVMYYVIPTSITSAKEEKLYSVETQQKAFFKNNKYAKKFYDESKDRIVNTPKYFEEKGKIVSRGVHSSLPIYRFEYRPNRVIQYKEDGARPLGYDDRAGKYPPRFFQKY